MTWDECSSGAVYNVSCATDQDGLSCRCSIDDAAVASFRWHDAVCFCDSEAVLVRECGFMLETRQTCVQQVYNNGAGFDL